MSQNNEEGVFNPIVFGAVLLAGAFAGTRVAAHIIPDSAVALIACAVMLPMGVILGLSVALGSMPTIALLNLVSVLSGRHTIDHMFAETGGKSGGLLSLQLNVVIVPVIASVVIAFVLDMFVKPEADFTELAMWFGGSGLAFGIVTAVMLMLLIPEE